MPGVYLSMKHVQFLNSSCNLRLWDKPLLQLYSKWKKVFSLTVKQ